MPLSLTQVDAFADRPFAGNPAAVCVLEGPADPDWMQAVALEMNLSETAFLHPEPEKDGVYRLRWFTPAREVDLCGHATLAAAHVLWEEGHLPTDRPARFETNSGRLEARRDGDGIRMDFPAEPVAACAEPEGLAEAIGHTPRFVGANRVYGLLELESETAVLDLKPDLRLVERWPWLGVIVTARSETPGRDFVSRFFAPRAGIDEDPVTGSAHCALGPYWAERLGRQNLTGYQASPRGGTVGVRCFGPRVELAGRAVTVLRGTLVGQAGRGFGSKSERH